MANKTNLNIFWFRRDLRISDNAGLYYALKAGLPVLPVFIFDRNILDQLPHKDDSRVTFIHRSLQDLNEELETHGSSLYILNSTPQAAFEELVKEFDISLVFTNSDYEPYARQRDQQIETFLGNKKIGFSSFKDQVIFEKDEILKDDKKPYTVFSAYRRKWMEKLNPDFHFRSYPTEKYGSALIQNTSFKLPKLEDLGFSQSNLEFPDKKYRQVLAGYKKARDFPAVRGTSEISVHLRFGTLSIRQAAREGLEYSPDTWLSELMWRDFYAMIIWHFPYSANSSFKPEYNKIRWRNNEDEFKAWCEGKTGYPIVDAGMRQLNTTGWMHNRVRMIVASFLCKHLLIDWRWGEAYFAEKLIDYDLASNVGGWQWAAGTGNDAAPYFRVFNPELQTKKFDPELQYIKKWVAEFDAPFKYPRPIVDHKFARERVLKAYKEALGK